MVTYIVFTVIQSLAILAYVFSCLHKINSNKSIIIRLVSSFITVICCIFRLILDAEVRNVNIFTLILAILYTISIAFSAYQLGQKDVIKLFRKW